MMIGQGIKMSRKVYSYEEVARHNVQNNIWIVIHGGVYDLTKFLREHPGGDEVLVNLAGGDGTDCFEAVGHSPEALRRRELYKIGEIDPTTAIDGSNAGTDAPQQGSKNENVEEPWDYVEHEEEQTSPWLFVFLGLGFLVYAIIFNYIL